MDKNIATVIPLRLTFSNCISTRLYYWNTQQSVMHFQPAKFVHNAVMLSSLHHNDKMNTGFLCTVV